MTPCLETQTWDQDRSCLFRIDPESLPGDGDVRRLRGRRPWGRRLRRIRPCTYRIHCLQPKLQPRRHTWWCGWILSFFRIKLRASITRCVKSRSGRYVRNWLHLYTRSQSIQSPNFVCRLSSCDKNSWNLKFIKSGRGKQTTLPYLVMWNSFVESKLCLRIFRRFT